jgi:hypothetical protein
MYICVTRGWVVKAEHRSRTSDFGIGRVFPLQRPLFSLLLPSIFPPLSCSSFQSVSFWIHFCHHMIIFRSTRMWGTQESLHFPLSHHFHRRTHNMHVLLFYHHLSCQGLNQLHPNLVTHIFVPFTSLLVCFLFLSHCNDVQISFSSSCNCGWTLILALWSISIQFPSGSHVLYGVTSCDECVQADTDSFCPQNTQNSGHYECHSTDQYKAEIATPLADVVINNLLHMFIMHILTMVPSDTSCLSSWHATTSPGTNIWWNWAHGARSKWWRLPCSSHPKVYNLWLLLYL